MSIYFSFRIWKMTFLSTATFVQTESNEARFNCRGAAKSQEF